MFSSTRTSHSLFHMRQWLGVRPHVRHLAELAKCRVILDAAVCGPLSSLPIHPGLCPPAPHQAPPWCLAGPSLTFHARVFGFISTYLRGTSSWWWTRFQAGRGQHNTQPGAWAGSQRWRRCLHTLGACGNADSPAPPTTPLISDTCRGRCRGAGLETLSLSLTTRSWS